MESQTDPGGDAVHVVLEVFHLVSLEGVSSGYQAAGTVRGGIVQVGVSLADADQGAVTHVNWDEHTLFFAGRYGTLAENHMLNVYIVVDDLPHGLRPEAHSFGDDADHRLAVQFRETLAETT